MAVEHVIICKCGQWNRLTDQRERSGFFSCGKCGNRLVLPKQSGWEAHKKWIWVPLILFVVVGIAAASRNFSSPSPPNATSAPWKSVSVAQNPAPAPRSSLPSSQRIEPLPVSRFDPIPVPPLPEVRTLVVPELPAIAQIAKPELKPVPIKTGIIRKTKGNAIAPLGIEAGGSNYAIKMVNMRSGAEEMLIYLESGKTFETKMPLGTYKVKVAAGNVWYGEKLLFGPSTSYFQLRRKRPNSNEEMETITFSRTDNRVNGHRIVLRGVIDGNLEQQRISANEF